MTYINTQQSPVDPAVSRRPNTLSRLVYGSIFGVVVFLSIVGTTWSVSGVPVRSLVAVISLGMVFLLVPRTVLRTIRRNGPTLFLLGGFAALGAVVSLANEESLATVASEVIQIHFQAAILFLLAYAISARIGVRSAALIFILCVTISTAVAAAQSLGMGWAWEVRLTVARLVGEDLLSDYYFRYARPMGLAYSPVRLGLQICLALAAYLIVAPRPFLAFQKFDNRVFIAFAIFAASSIAGQNRSPLLGGLIMLLVYLCALRPKYIGILVAAIVVALPLGLTYLDTFEGSRVATVADESSLGRITFLVYGLILFVNRPIGYGLGFNPIDYWPYYWEDIQWTPVPYFIQVFPLHNYFLTILNMYGFFVLFFVPIIIRIAKKYNIAVISLIPYWVHILFHNDGPMWSDFVVWFVFAFAVYAKDEEKNISEMANPALRRG